MKEKLKLIWINNYINFLRLKLSIFPKKNLNSSVLILPPAPPGSLGDEALVCGAIEYLRDTGIKKIGIISHEPSRQWKLDYKTPEIHHHFLGGVLVGDKARFEFAKAVSQYDKFYCIGADVMDGYYFEPASVQRVEFVSLAHSMGIETAILGFSFNNKPTPGSLEAFQKLPKTVPLNARDPVSYERLIHHLQRPVRLVADLAFLLHPIEESEIVTKVKNWVEEQRNQNRILIGINSNYKLIENLKEQSVDNLVQAYVSAIVELYSQKNNLSFVLIPHDFRSLKGDDSDVAVAEAIFKKLPEEIQTHSFIVPTPCKAAEIKGICKHLDLVVSGRMHLAIASLGQGTPAACITYQGKFEGLYKHFELEGMTIDPEQALQTKKFVEFLTPLIDKQEELKEKIKLKLPQIKKLSQSNFEV